MFYHFCPFFTLFDLVGPFLKMIHHFWHFLTIFSQVFGEEKNGTTMGSKTCQSSRRRSSRGRRKNTLFVNFCQLLTLFDHVWPFSTILHNFWPFLKMFDRVIGGVTTAPQWGEKRDRRSSRRRNIVFWELGCERHQMIMFHPWVSSCISLPGDQHCIVDCTAVLTYCRRCVELNCGYAIILDAPK